MDWTLPHWTGAEAKALSALLPTLADADYLAFHSRLIATAAPMYGVRLPQLRALAKQVVRGNWREFLAVFRPVAYEEILLRGFVIGLAQGEPSELLELVAEYIPLIDNWAVNDSFAAAAKLAVRYPAQVWDFLQPYLRSEKEFELRFGVTMLMDYYLTEQYIDRVLAIYASVRHEGYYVKMAVAWALSVCYVKFPERTLSLLTRGCLDDFTHNKAIQKCLESRRLSPEDKALLRTMKRGPGRK